MPKCLKSKASMLKNRSSLFLSPLEVILPSSRGLPSRNLLLLLSSELQGFWLVSFWNRIVRCYYLGCGMPCDFGVQWPRAARACLPVMRHPKAYDSNHFGNRIVRCYLGFHTMTWLCSDPVLRGPTLLTVIRYPNKRCCPTAEPEKNKTRVKDRYCSSIVCSPCTRYGELDAYCTTNLDSRKNKRVSSSTDVTVTKFNFFWSHCHFSSSLQRVYKHVGSSMHRRLLVFMVGLLYQPLSSKIQFIKVSQYYHKKGFLQLL